MITIICRGNVCRKLKGVRFRNCWRSDVRLHEGRKMILDVKLLVRELTLQWGQEESSRDQKESPFPWANELPSFSRGGILHGTRLDGRRAQAEKRRRTSAKGCKLCDRVCSDFSRIFHIQTASPALFTFSFMFSCLMQRSPHVSAFFSLSRSLISLRL